MSRKERNTLTIEDPVEYLIPAPERDREPEREETDEERRKRLGEKTTTLIALGPLLSAQ